MLTESKAKLVAQNLVQSTGVQKTSLDFNLAPSGAQEMQISVRLSVCPMKSVLEVKIFILISGRSQSSLRSTCAYFSRQTEPKILCLVLGIISKLFL